MHRLMRFWRVRFRGLRAPAASALRRGQGLPPPFPASLSPLAASFLRCAPDRFHMTKPNTFQHNREASVATLRWCSGSSRNAVRLPSGTSVQLHRNPQKLRFLRPFTSLRRDVPFWNVASGLEPLCQIAIQMGLGGEESLAITL